MKRTPIALALALMASAPLAAPAAAETESAYGCRLLSQAEPEPLLEGSDGVFYRANLDLRMNHPLSPEAAETLGRLSDLLASRGTRLIFLPVPTKGLAMPQYLPPESEHYGFDLEVADIAYQALVDKLREAGVVVANTLPALRETDRPFIGTDFHWSAEGARAAAGVLADTIRELPEYAEAEKTPHETKKVEMRTFSSELRRRIQPHCRDAVPMADTQGYVTEGAGGGASGGDGGIFAGEDSVPPLALIGTSMSAETTFNFEGFLAEASELSVANYAITGGNQFGSITSYLLSEDFQQNPPRFLVWENPIYNNLGGYGALPLLELLAAAANHCTPVETERLADTELRATLPTEGLDRESFVRVDTGRANGRQATFDFRTGDGLEVGSTITRPPRYEATRWFYQSLGPLGHTDMTEVRVTTDRPVTEDATISICETKGDST